MVKVSRCMSTQHPDNVSTPFFSDREVLAGEDEIKEAYFVFSQLNCKEQMWDGEGKEVDEEVVEKLFTRYPEFFSKSILGKDFFLTYRVPNPSVQKEKGKVMFETLHSITRAADAAKIANNQDIPPIFELILPMTTSLEEIEMVKEYYEKVIIGQKNIVLHNKKTVKEWVGDFQPESINVIPLFEDQNALLNSAKIVEEYLKKKDYEYQRVFLARSDPALNYGSACAVLLAKIALMRLQDVEDKISIDLLPILGVGSAPFRGNFRPDNVDNCGDEYPSVQTFTAQSSFKYDNSFKDVANAIDMLNLSRRGKALNIDEKRALFFVEKIKNEYQTQISSIFDIINNVSAFVPSKRSRKLHVGLFGYSRSLKGVKLPRAISFCASLYSIGLPPELLGLSALNEKEFDELHNLYVKVDEDLQDVAKFINMNNINKLPNEVKKGVTKVLGWIDYEEDDNYVHVTTKLYDALLKGDQQAVKENLKNAAWMRKFLG
ncbi:MAG: phosphoenolpyruvate carboxylase [Candidatus Micrarchaeota archaeon]